MTPKDVADLAAFLRTLPAVKGKAPANALPFPFSIRRAVGLWKLLYFDNASLRPDPSQSEQWNRGRYLVEGPGHCGECHTPRGLLGEMDLSRALAGAPLPDGHGKAANLRGGDFLNWTDADIVEALTSGFTPAGDVLGAGMTAVVRNLAELPESDRQAIAVYLKSLPPLGPPTRRRSLRLDAIDAHGTSALEPRLGYRLPWSAVRPITGSTLSARSEAGAMKAGDVMTSAVISATGDTPVRDIAQLLLQNHISAIPILDKSGAPIGMVSEGDLIGRDETQRNARREWWLALLAEGESLSPDFLSSLRRPERIASDIMSTPVITIAEDTDTGEIARLLAAHRIKRVPVVRNGHVVGIVQPRESAAHACE